MCLESVDKITKNVTEGWKIFEVHNNKLYGLFQPYRFEINKWIKDTNKQNIKTPLNNEYKTGFHFFINKEDVEEDILLWNDIDDDIFRIKIKVKVRNVVATGFQDGYRIGVAREIFVEEE